MYLAKTPSLIKPLTRDLVWSVPTEEPVLYLTFDDGPIPEVTEFVLQTLAEYEAKATFFCIGDNVSKHPQIFQRLLDEGHAVGNHTYNHLNGWQVSQLTYLRNVVMGAQAIPGSLFRPPYGRISRNQVAALKTSYKIIMWDVLSADFDQHITPERCLRNVTENAGPGSIIVFHDSLKAYDRMAYALPRTLEHFAAQGYRFEKLQPELLA